MTMIEDWKTRLEQCVADSGQSMRSISLEAGLDPGYLRKMLKEDTMMPTVPKLLAICDVLNVEPAYIISGFDVSLVDAELQRLFAALPPESRRVFLELARQMAAKFIK